MNLRTVWEYLMRRVLTELPHSTAKLPHFLSSDKSVNFPLTCFCFFFWTLIKSLSTFSLHSGLFPLSLKLSSSSTEKLLMDWHCSVCQLLQPLMQKLTAFSLSLLLLLEAAEINSLFALFFLPNSDKIVLELKKRGGACKGRSDNIIHLPDT